MNEQQCIEDFVMQDMRERDGICVEVTVFFNYFALVLRSTRMQSILIKLDCS